MSSDFLNSSPIFKVMEPATLENKGIIPLPKVDFQRSEQDMIAFIPSAGMATRFGVGTPKIFSSATKDNLSFYHAKLLEHEAVSNLATQIFVVQPQTFTEDQLIKSSIPQNFMYQDGPMLTPRLSLTGEKLLEKDGKISLVPAGHGSLTKLFPGIKNQWPQAKGLWIRNIDNVMGDNPRLIDFCNHFLNYFCYLVSQANNDKTHRKPISLLGMVKKNSNDIGGTPCWVEYKSKKFLLCAEWPHIAHQEELFKNDNCFFNPVFIATELHGFTHAEHPFWAYVQKTHHNQPVYYREEFLSEMIGNSLYAQTTFIEIPRELFNPHKTQESTEKRLKSDWFGDV